MLSRRSLPCFVDTFPALQKQECCKALFIAKQPHVDVHHERETIIQRLQPGYHQALEHFGLAEFPIVEAQQVHGAQVAVVEPKNFFYAGVDALITELRGVCLKIFVADCAAVYFVDRLGRAIGLAHSGRKGTELGIVPATIQAMQEVFHILPRDLIVQISPCIRPTHYEVDFAADILQQARKMGVEEIVDCGICTACHPDRYYSYRMEKGKTGRMAAILALL